MMSQINISFIANQLGSATRRGNEWSCLCPAHNDHNPSLSLGWDEKTQTLLAKCWVGCSFEDIISALKNRGLLPKRPVDEKSEKSRVYSSKVPKASKVDEMPSKIEVARHIWFESISPQGSLVESYLVTRGYNGSISATIRYNSRLFHGPSKSYYPAMVAAITRWPDKTVSSIHRTYLNSDGSDKAPISPNKMMLGSVSGGALRLSSSGSKLILAEGIETALSCFGATGISTWACLSTSGMVNVVIPPFDITQAIIIAADNDLPGQEAAGKLAQRLLGQGYAVRIAMPTKEKDFNDILRRQ